jgi:GGDEF domain-containing protein
VKTLKASIRTTDTIARFDGDHFFILIEHIHSAEILSMIANRIQPASGNRLAEEIRYNIGAVLCDDSYHEIDEILRNVKTAHRLAKTGGQMGYRIFSSDGMKAINNH